MWLAPCYGKIEKVVVFYCGGCSSINLDVSFIILAGGKSTRLGRNKVVEKIGNQSLIERVLSSLSTFDREVIVVIAGDSSLPELTGYPKLKIVRDIYPGKGSLGGIYTGLVSSNSLYNVVVACDMPFLNLDLIRYMTGITDGVDAVVPKRLNNIEPLHAVYSKNCIHSIEGLLDQNRLSILELFPLIKVRYLESSEINQFDFNNLSFFNINTESDLNIGKELILKEDFRVISVEQALEKILSSIVVLEEEDRPILECLGQVLAEDIYSQIDVPPRDNSALDGYAVRSVDIKGASSQKPRYLKVIDMIIAGQTPHKPLEAGTAIRIMTGAPTPEGADCVIGFENTDETKQGVSATGIPAQIGIMIEEESGANIRLAGESIHKGDRVLSKGLVIRPSEIGILASMGRPLIRVIRRPVVAILATGDELTNLGEPLSEGKIYNSNTYSVASQVTREGGVPKLLGIALDNEASVVNKIKQGLDADLLITIGGVSMGDYDVVKNVLSKQGEIVFWKVRTKPGKPLAFGTIKRMDKGIESRGLPHLGLAGNAVSCMVNYELFVRPAILKMMGKTNLKTPHIEAVIEDNISNDDGRRIFARVKVEKRKGEYFAKLTGPQGSGILTSMVLANGLAVVPENRERIAAGEKLQVMMLDWQQDI
jgi:molybdopterin molybdotransferase